MVESNSPGEQSPLLRRSTSSSTALSSVSKSSQTLSNREGNVKNDEAITVSTSRGVLICASIGLLIFLQATNISILTTTQSAIAADLNAFEQATWLTSSYLIAMSSLAPLMGRLSQVFSARLVLFCCTLIICVGTIIIATSVSYTMFIVGRVITGAGAAGVLIVSIIIVVQLASPKQRGLYIGLVNTGITVGVALGAIIAGALEPKIGWKPLFGIQAPLSLLAGFGLLFGIPAKFVSGNGSYANISLRQKLARIDYAGSVLLTLTIILFLLGLSGPSILATPIILSALTLPLFVLNEVYIAKDPVIPVTVLGSRGTLLTCLATVGFMMARWCVLFYTPVYALSVRGWRPAVAGSILIPTNAGFASGGLLAGVFHIRRNGSFYLPTLISMGLFPITLLILAFISTAESNWGAYVAMVFCNGLLTGAALNYALVHLLHLTSPEVHPIALSLLATFRGFAGSFGSAIGGGLFSRVLRKSLVDGFKAVGLERKDLIIKLQGSPALVGELHGTERAVAISAYESAVKALFLGGVALAVLVVFIQAGTGWKEPAKLEDDSREEGEEEEEEALIAGS
ncbi:MFS general substrate transporter [Amniculicola lignicola CBS 123094]|uniref:MFS general substrate transporter n=1 Tax=Amniculicola lignicola CBS 123094 TaxID=1392246 RepID=A0A6A5W9T0_9PLEO|nr:MFS general substrate transporter [Amniculicola lignicola CBS 123094]